MSEINMPLWKIRKMEAKGRGFKVFQIPAQLWNAACEYFEYVDNNPYCEYKVFKGDEALTKIPQIRPYTLTGLCFFLACSESYFRAFKYRIRERIASETSKDLDSGFMEVIDAIEQVIETQQLEGAMLGIFNYNIVRAKLGLVEKQDLTSNGETVFSINVRGIEDQKAIEELE